jgi:hypothetical protein
MITKLVKVNVTSWRSVLSVGLAAATLAVILTYVLGAQAILQSPYAEPSHKLFMSIYVPLIQGITGGHSSMSQLHGGPASDSQMQGMSESQMQRTMGLIGNNMLGSPTGPAAAGFGAVVIMGVIVLTGAAFVVSWKQRSFLVAVLLASSGAILMILPIAKMNFVIPGPIIGVSVGLMILGLGVAMVIGTIKTAAVAAR